MTKYAHPRTAGRVHVPELEQWAINQKPKTSDHRDPKLYRYEDTNLYQWFSRRGSPFFQDPVGEPFVIEPVSWLRPGAPVFYDDCLRCVVVENVEGWWKVRFLADDSTAVVRPSALRPRTEDEQPTEAA